MKLHCSFLCLCVFVLSVWCEEETSGALNPRGPRPIEPGFKADNCATEKEWPFCTDDEWGRKCPSGCRIQGLLDQTNHEILKKLEKIRNLLDEGKKLHRSTDLESKNTYNYLRERLVSNTGNDNRYASLAEQLRQRIVDIDIKLRSCRGSCASYINLSLEKDSNEALEKQLERLESLKVQSVETVSSLKVLKSKVLKDVIRPSIYKSGTSGTEVAAQKKLLFTDVGQLQLSLEAEGSTAETAATVSKVSTGTGQTTPIANSHISTQTHSCTQTVRKITTHTKDGIQEKYETVRSGPGCDTIGKLGFSESELLSAAKDGKELTADGFKIKVSGGDSNPLPHSATVTKTSVGSLETSLRGWVQLDRTGSSPHRSALPPPLNPS
ncbi:Fibrinogen alpha chain [Bagarius yarrelli]|uniref:Fibrinogen alpha chain n=1 Tax=Bagarius yarrelli TaxID=175774 RepID=A0A556VU68_BAGYA|nr:Fibrinogen alpha chain [Bagarius yarrelli]